MYLRLLVTRQAIMRVLREGARAPGDPPPVPGISGQKLEQRLAELKRRLADDSISDDLRRSLQGQADLLQQRVLRRGEADGKLAFLDAELTRIEEQVELIREQAVLSTDPESLSQRIDEISATLGTTGEWIADQQKTIGAMDDLIADPPPLASQTRAREHN
jgi:chromosome segregation ATPase